MSADPQQLATQLNNRRISAQTIKEWQWQAGLVCRVPELRGHDAQVLVACGITSAEDLARLTAEELWTRVRPFIDTIECKRIIRSGKMPDPQEIANWIRWSQNARTLQAA
jgi:hypothetical protein